VDSREGEGSCFRVLLPSTNLPLEPVAAAVAGAPERKSQGGKA
jgi:hypothetical protein